MGNGAAGTEAGFCEMQGFEGVYGCDYAWRNTAKMSPCGDAKRSKYAVSSPISLPVSPGFGRMLI